MIRSSSILTPLILLSAWCIPMESARAEPFRVVCLNPVIADLAHEVAGDALSVVSLLPPGADPHAFRPTPADFAAMRDADLILASGKGLEPSLADIHDSIPHVELLEVSRILPGLKIEANGAEFASCPHHDVRPE